MDCEALGTDLGALDAGLGALGGHLGALSADLRALGADLGAGCGFRGAECPPCRAPRLRHRPGAGGACGDCAGSRGRERDEMRLARIPYLSKTICPLSPALSKLDVPAAHRGGEKEKDVSGQDEPAASIPRSDSALRLRGPLPAAGDHRPGGQPGYRGSWCRLSGRVCHRLG